MNKIRTDSARSQSGAQTTKFHREKLSFTQSAKPTTKFHLRWMNILKTMSPKSYLHKNPHTLKMREGRFASVCLVEEYIFGTRKQKYRLKSWTRCKIVERFLKMKNEDRKIEDIPAAELNEYISEFIISIRTKDGNEYEATSLSSKFNGQLRTTFEEKGLFCQHNQRLGLWENQKSSSIQAKTADEVRKRE